MGQPSYAQSINRAQLGDAADSDSYRGRLESYLVENDEAIIPGYFVAQGTADGQAILPEDANSIILGVVYNGTGRKLDNDTGLIENYGQNDRISVATEDVFYVYSEEAATKGDQVFVRHTASGGNTVLGAARTDANTATAVAVTAEYAETITGAGLAKVKLLMAQV
jgi:hypothetical protein